MFPWTRKNDFRKTGKYFPTFGKNLKEWEKLNFVRKDQLTKNYGKNFSKKTNTL